MTRPAAMETVLFTLGSLTVTAVQTVLNENVTSVGFYWKDEGSPQGYGPFESLHAAMDHYKWLIQTTKGVQTSIEVHGTGATSKPVMGKVIRVDFQAKRRVSDQ